MDIVLVLVIISSVPASDYCVCNLVSAERPQCYVNIGHQTCPFRFYIAASRGCIQAV